jgi:hypothetical protein
MLLARDPSLARSESTMQEYVAEAVKTLRLELSSGGGLLHSPEPRDPGGLELQTCTIRRARPFRLYHHTTLDGRTLIFARGRRFLSAGGVHVLEALRRIDRGEPVLVRDLVAGEGPEVHALVRKLWMFHSVHEVEVSA